MDKRIVEGIEACRPRSGDLQSAELSDVAERVQSDPAARAYRERVEQWDIAIRDAMSEVAVPAGLADRLLARLRTASEPNVEVNASASPTERAETDSVGNSESGENVVELPARGARWSRRRFLGACAAISGVLLAAVFVHGWLLPRDDGPLEELADAWQRELGVKWQEMKLAPADLTVPAAIVASPLGWQRIVGKHALGRGVAYKLVNAKGQSAVLFVMRLVQPGLSALPPGRPQSTTGGKAVGYWQAAGRIYVLVVEQGEPSYRSFVSTQSSPLA